MNKKGFTLAELLGVVVILAITSGLVVISVTALIKNGKNGVYQNLEKTLRGGAENYFIDNSSSIPSINGSKNITYIQLLNGNYIDKYDDPNGGDCSSSYVIVSRENNKGINGVNYNLKYKSCVVCKDNKGNIHYKSDGC